MSACNYLGNYEVLLLFIIITFSPFIVYLTTLSVGQNCMALNGRVIKEWDGNDTERKCSWNISRYYFDLRLERLKKTTKNLTKNNRCWSSIIIIIITAVFQNKLSYSSILDTADLLLPTSPSRIFWCVLWRTSWAPVRCVPAANVAYKYTHNFNRELIRLLTLLRLLVVIMCAIMYMGFFVQNLTFKCYLVSGILCSSC
jgi:hypothetical protein